MKTNVEDKLLATHISDNKDFATACSAGDGRKIMMIVVEEMEKNNLKTKGAIKLRDDIFKKLRGGTKVSQSVGNDILSFVWNSRLSGTGYAVVN